MTTLVFQPFALRQGRLSCGLTLEEIHETLRHAHGIVLAASGHQVKMSWGPAFMLDYPEGTLGTSVPATENTRVGVLGQLRSHEYLQRILPPRGLIRVFFVWDFASHAKGQIKTGNEKPNDPGRPVMVQPKGVTINSHWLMVLGAKASLRERSLSTAHEIGHALLGSDPSVHRDDDRGNLMFGDTGGVGAKLDAVQLGYFIKNAARVAAATNIVGMEEFQYKKPPG